MPIHRSHLSLLIVMLTIAAAAPLALAGAGAGDDRRMLLITDSLDVLPVRLISIDDHHVRFREIGREEAGMRSIALEYCAAVMDPDATVRAPRLGRLELIDGQRYPGEPDQNDAEAPADTLAWRHPMIGRISVPLDRIRTARFRHEAQLPEPGSADTVLLTNGDTLEGFILGLGHPVELEVDTDDGPEIIEIPHDRIASVRLVASRAEPAGRRIWLRNGTVLDAREVAVDEDGGVELLVGRHDQGTDTIKIDRREVIAIAFAPARFTPLAALTLQRVEGPATRYTVPAPEVLDDDAPLGLAPLEYRGPVRVHYRLPREAASGARLAAEVELPRAARPWAGFELVIRADGREIFRQAPDAREPVMQVNVPLGGSELTIELTDGPYGAIRNQLIFRRAMILVE